MLAPIAAIYIALSHHTVFTIESADASNETVNDGFYQEIKYELEKLASDNALATLHTLNHTYCGNELVVLELSDKSTAGKRSFIWIDAGIYGYQWTSILTARYIIDKLLKIEDNTQKNVDWYIMPVVNPDGYEYSRKYKRFYKRNKYGCLCGGNDSTVSCGVELNRNFDFDWGVGDNRNSGHYKTDGRKASSEIETASIQNFLLKLSQQYNGNGVYLSLHANSPTRWLYPSQQSANDDEIIRVAKAALDASYTLYGARTPKRAEGAWDPTSGASMNWAKFKANIRFAYTVEVPFFPRSSVEQYSELNNREIQNVAERFWSGLLQVYCAIAEIDDCT